VRGRQRSLTVDLHCHALTDSRWSSWWPAAAEACRARSAAAHDGPGELRVHGQRDAQGGIPETHQILRCAWPTWTPWAWICSCSARPRTSTTTGPIPELGRQICAPDQRPHRIELVAQHPDRLLGLGSVALQHPVAVRSSSSTTRSRTLGLRGVEVSSMVNGLELADPKFERFWARVEQLGLPRVPASARQLARRAAEPALPVQQHRPAARDRGGALVPDLRRHPRPLPSASRSSPRTAAAMRPSYIGRSDHAWHARPDARGCQRAPSTYLRQIYYDTIVYRPGAAAAPDRRGRRQPGSWSAPTIRTTWRTTTCTRLLAAVPGLSEPERAAILGGNAARLLDLPPRSPSPR
jgi:hypothetical protein